MTLRCDQLHLGYGSRDIVRGLDLSIACGRITALIGPNGCGKSTLLRALAGLLAPKSGAVLLGNEPLSDWPRRKLARRIAFLSQHPPLPEGLTVRELVRHGRFPHHGPFGGDSEADRNVARWAMDVTGLASFQARPLSELSGGERQRAWIAMALAQQSDILLMDEPTTYLDLGHQLEVLHLLRALNAKHGITMVLSLHDLNQAMHYADRVVAMQAGAVVAEGAPVEVINDTLLAEVFGVRARLIPAVDGRGPVCHAEGPLHAPALA